MDFSNEENVKTGKSANWIFFFRQLFSCGTVVLNCFIFGLYMGAPTVTIPQIKKETNSTDIATPDMLSWLSSISAYSAIPWAILLPAIAHLFGRKISLILINLDVLLTNVVFYWSTNVKQLIISQAMSGMLVASVLPITILVTSEYPSPKYRGIFCAIKGATFFWGVWVSNAIGTFFHWRNIGILVFVCGIYNLISCIFLNESPYWLATKGRFDECAKIHRWLKGTDDISDQELRKLIISQEQYLNTRAELEKQMKHSKIITCINVARSEEFYKPLLIAVFPVFLYNLSGKVACSVYAIDILKKITSSERMAYDGMLILDAVTVVSMYLGCALSKIIARRKQLLFFSYAGVIFLYVLSLYLYLIKLSLIYENNYVSLFFLIGFSVSISCGPIILASACSAELTPLRHRSLFVCCLGILANTVFATILKISPLIFINCGMHGAFLFYAASATICVFFLYKYLPETKDKTIQEIQELINGVQQNVTFNIDLASLKKHEFKSDE